MASRVGSWWSTRSWGNLCLLLCQVASSLHASETRDRDEWHTRAFGFESHDYFRHRGVDIDQAGSSDVDPITNCGPHPTNKGRLETLRVYIRIQIHVKL